MRLKLETHQTRGPSTASAAVALFLILCGLLVFLGSPKLSCGGRFAEQKTSQRILDALKSTSQAEQALAEGNYGVARRHVQRAQNKLTDALQELQGNTQRNYPQRNYPGKQP